jgi:hypothetical protein
LLLLRRITSGLLGIAPSPLVIAPGPLLIAPVLLDRAALVHLGCIGVEAGAVAALLERGAHLPLAIRLHLAAFVLNEKSTIHQLLEVIILPVDQHEPKPTV